MLRTRRGGHRRDERGASSAMKCEASSYVGARLQRTRGDKGAAVVEFALVMPLLFILMFGIITFGLAYHEKTALANAVREGSRFGATVESGATWGADVVNRTKSVLFSTANPANVNVCAKLLQADGTVIDASACSLPSTDEPATPSGVAGCLVKVWGSQDANLNIAVKSWNVRLTGRSVAVYERIPCGATP